ncbi:winged helix-turn-helix transcriptional regulator [Roseateles chitinivorans]|uniref:winged helix-turn-helix transcriptional regulator n=1 Tax=Roseateles chitinivorans TaxID=2917965 RepID=UPI003D663C82
MKKETSAAPPTPVEECRGLAQIIDRVGDKWTVMVVGHLSSGTLRFNELMRCIPGISHRMLTLTLRALERDGLVDRTSYPTSPPRVDYALTALGQSLTEPLRLLAVWASDRREDIAAAQRAYDARLKG